MDNAEISLKPVRSNLRIIDDLTQNTAKLSAMLAMIYGGGYENFEEMNDTIKGNYLWACADLAREVDRLAGELSVT